MLVKILKTNQTTAYITFFIITILFFALKVLGFNEINLNLSHPILYCFSSFFIKNPFLAKSIICILSLLTAMGWNNSLIDRGIFKSVSSMPALFFILFSNVFNVSSVWLCVFILLFVLNKLMLCFNLDRPYSLLFESGFLIGIATLINPLCLFFFMVVFVANIIYVNHSWRNFLIPTIGLFVPFFMKWSYGYYFDCLDVFYNFYFGYFKLTVPSFILSFPFLLWYVIMLVLFFFSIKELILWLNMKSLRSRKGFYLLFAYSVCAFITLFFTKNSWNTLLFFVLPFSALISNYFMFIYKRWWYESLFVFIVISTIYLQLSSIL